MNGQERYRLEERLEQMETDRDYWLRQYNMAQGDMDYLKQALECAATALRNEGLNREADEAEKVLNALKA